MSSGRSIGSSGRSNLFRKPEVPRVGKAWGRTNVDPFILAQLKQQGLRPGSLRRSAWLIRRATFDLTGLPPTPEEVEAFLADSSADAFAKVVDRLLDSPHYGERWGRHWLDLARYGDGMSAASKDTPFPYAYRYRDWVIDSFNRDMPYDRFVKAQLAADLFPEGERKALLPALGFHALGKRDDDRVDVTGRVFLGLTLGCAQCHDHKYDPVPTKDFYSLQGVFSSSEKHEYPLAPDDVVQAYKDAEERVQKKKIEIAEFLKRVTDQLIDIFMSQTADYMTAAWRVMDGGEELSSVVGEAALDTEILQRWIEFPQAERPRNTAFWMSGTKSDNGARCSKRDRWPSNFEETLLAVHQEKREVDDANYVLLGGAKGARTQRNLIKTPVEFIEPAKWYVWRDLAYKPHRRAGLEQSGGVYYFGPEAIECLLSPVWVQHLQRQKAELQALEEEIPPLYPFIHGYRDSDEPKDAQVAIRGDKKNLGAVAPRRFLRILSRDEPKPFTQGSGRWELAEAVAGADNPLTACVMVNRIWQKHFGRGIVISPSNLGRLGDRPTHPKLLDYLAARFVESGWSVKSIHREIMLSATHQLSSAVVKRNYKKDGENRYYWRFNVPQASRCRGDTRFDAGRGGESRPHAGRAWETARRRQSSPSCVRPDQPHVPGPHADAVRLPRPEGHGAGA